LGRRYPIFFNLEVWSKPSDQQKKILSDEARKAEDAFYVDWVKLANDEEAQLKAKGAQSSSSRSKRTNSAKNLGMLSSIWPSSKTRKILLSCANSQSRTGRIVGLRRDAADATS
jgi:TRAP-type C4-dicarboxylate transport system substrate-binding protein